MKQRVGIIRALATGPRCFCSTSRSARSTHKRAHSCKQILTNMWQRLKTSVLFVTHDIDEAIFLSDRVLLHDGAAGHHQSRGRNTAGAAAQQSMMMSSEVFSRCDAG